MNQCDECKRLCSPTQKDCKKCNSVTKEFTDAVNAFMTKQILDGVEKIDTKTNA